MRNQGVYIRRCSTTAATISRERGPTGLRDAGGFAGAHVRSPLERVGRAPDHLLGVGAARRAATRRGTHGRRCPAAVRRATGSPRNCDPLESPPCGDVSGWVCSSVSPGRRAHSSPPRALSAARVPPRSRAGRAGVPAAAPGELLALGRPRGPGGWSTDPATSGVTYDDRGRAVRARAWPRGQAERETARRRGRWHPRDVASVLPRTGR